MRRFLSSLLDFGETAIVAFGLVLFIRTFIAQPFLVSGASMHPILNDKDYLLVDEVTYRFRSPKRGEIIVFRYQASGDNKHFIKRIIGLEGEKVVVDNGTISIYSPKDKHPVSSLKESYINNSWHSDRVEIALGPDEYFVMGDNRSFSFDSRNWGALNKKSIIGLVRFRLWPVNQVMAISAPSY